jgi:hypothetical protein
MSVAVATRTVEKEFLVKKNGVFAILAQETIS